MNKAALLGFTISVLAFLGIDRVLNSGEYPSNLTKIQNQSPEEKKQVILEMANFVEKNPGVIDLIKTGAPSRLSEPSLPAPESHPIMVAGIPLNEHTLQTLQDPAGLAAFKEKLNLNPMGAISDVHQAFYSLDALDFKSREVLLEVAGTLMTISDNDDLKKAIVGEVEKYYSHAPENDMNMEYAGKALQQYLNSEKDPNKLSENLKKMGIPHTVLPSGEGASDRAPASVDSSQP